MPRSYYTSSVLADGNIAKAFLYNGDLRSLIENAYRGSGYDSITGNVAGNYLRRKGGNDALSGLEGEDLPEGTSNDTLLGSTGNDSAFYCGYHFEFDLINLGSGSYWLDDLRSSDAEGTDALSGIEFFIFDDGRTAWPHSRHA